MKDTKSLIERLYPIISRMLSDRKNENKLKQIISDSFNKKAGQLHDIAPYDRIYFYKEEADDLFALFGIDENGVADIINETYFGKMDNFNPSCAKDAIVAILMCCIKFYNDKKDRTMAELMTIYCSFSAKFYPSIHYGFFQKCPPREHEHVMTFVVNNMLTDKFDLKREGSVFKTIKSICVTLLNTYGNRFSDFDDEDYTYICQQLHTRLKSFMKNIADLYYKAYANKDALTFDSDNLDEDNYHLADNNSLMIDRLSDKVLNKVMSFRVNFVLCKFAADVNVKADDIQNIMEAVTGDKNNTKEIKELCVLLLSEYMKDSKYKDPKNPEFIKFSMVSKPNTKNKNIIRIKTIIETWLDEYSDSYRKRKVRPATKNSYFKAILLYFVMTIHNEAKG